MKVIGITSSPSRNGNTAVLVRETLKGIEKNGGEVEEFYLPDFNIEFCKGCMTCMKKSYCPIDDDVNNMKEKMMKADGLVFGSPTYGLSENAIMKQFRERIGMFIIYTGSFKGKYAIGISTCGGIGAGGVAKSLVNIIDSCFGRGYITGTLGVTLGHKRIEDYPEQMKKAYWLGEKMYKDILNGNTYPVQNIFKRILNKLVIKRFFLKNVLENKDGAMKGVYENLKNKGIVN